MRRLSVVVALVLATAVTLTAVAPPAGEAAPTEPSQVVIIGDSIIHNAREFYPVGIINAHNGRGGTVAGYGPPDHYSAGWGDYGTGVEAVAELVGFVASGGWLVMEIGTNDIHSGVPIEEYQEFVTGTVEALPEDRCLAWVVPWVPGMPERTSEFQAVLRETVPQQECSSLVEWGAVAEANPTLLVDGIHPNDAGSTVLSTLIYATIGHQSAASAASSADQCPTITA